MIKVFNRYDLLFKWLSMGNEHKIESFSKIIAVGISRIEFVIVDSAKDKVGVFLAEYATLKCVEKLGEQTCFFKNDLKNICIAICSGVSFDLDSFDLIHDVVSELAVKLGQPLEV